MISIQVSNSTYDCLNELANEQDSPNDVILKLIQRYNQPQIELNDSTEIKAVKPDLLFFPSEAEIKRICSSNEHALFEQNYIEDIEAFVETDNGERVFVKAPEVKDNRFRSRLWSTNLNRWKERGIVLAFYNYIPYYEQHLTLYGVKVNLKDIANQVGLKMLELKHFLNSKEKVALRPSSIWGEYIISLNFDDMDNRHLKFPSVGYDRKYNTSYKDLNLESGRKQLTLEEIDGNANELYVLFCFVCGFSAVVGSDNTDFVCQLNLVSKVLQKYKLKLEQKIVMPNSFNPDKDKDKDETPLSIIKIIENQLINNVSYAEVNRYLQITLDVNDAQVSNAYFSASIGPFGFVRSNGIVCISIKIDDSDQDNKFNCIVKLLNSLKENIDNEKNKYETDSSSGYAIIF
ncbi:MAG: hypothetical protein COA76_12010 [Moritella sp.]|nr:MAG: hypothetical protein COA76_12010 [Moritella sp.]